MFLKCINSSFSFFVFNIEDEPILQTTFFFFVVLFKTDQNTEKMTERKNVEIKISKVLLIQFQHDLASTVCE